MAWLESLTTPAGVFVATDQLAKLVSDVCWQHRIRVPEQVAILGADNDQALLEMCNPALSSIDTNGVRVGFEAAALLDGLMAGRRVGQRTVRIPPQGVVLRRSTDLLAIDDDVVAEAVRFIHTHRNRPITVKQVVSELSVSRRSLELRFSRSLRRTPWQEIRRSQIEHVKQMLRETDLPVQDLARSSAFGNSRRLSTIFRQETGATPTGYRRKHRAGT